MKLMRTTPGRLVHDATRLFLYRGTPYYPVESAEEDRAYDPDDFRPAYPRE